MYYKYFLYVNLQVLIHRIYWKKNWGDKFLIRVIFSLCGAILGTPRYVVRWNFEKKNLENIPQSFLF